MQIGTQGSHTFQLMKLMKDGWLNKLGLLQTDSRKLLLSLVLLVGLSYTIMSKKASSSKPDLTIYTKSKI